jgi:two-component system alkaline phosphatase synthesis response regulator PhoP
MMPEMDGIETCYEMREIPALKKSLIIFLTARNEDFSQIAGLEAGADDYISKPIKPKVFLSRISALLRRVSKHKIQIFGNIEINFESMELKVNGEKKNIRKKEFLLLKLLTSKPGKVFRRNEIYNNVWGSNVVVGDRTIDVHMRKLREKIGNHYFKTVKGVGYKLVD